jgi:hypothetical protein
MQQARDLLPMLDAIEISSRTLHGIIENILSFLDLKGQDNMLATSTSGMLTSPPASAVSIEVMFEVLIEEACEEDKGVRTARGQLQSSVENIFAIVPALQGEQFHRRRGKCTANNFNARSCQTPTNLIELQGYVEITVDDVTCHHPSETCEDLSLNSMISIMIVDSGKGMEQNYVKEKLGEPRAKEYRFVTGFGLSVHLAWQNIDSMGGIMEISSAPDCTVKIEFPVQRRRDPNQKMPGVPTHFVIASHLVLSPNTLQRHRHIALLGFGVMFKGRCVGDLT